MGKKFIIRLDDISWDMNYENYERVRNILIKYNIKPIIGVIPYNEDKKLISTIGKKHQKPDKFWEEIKILQRKYKWSIALHGYNHVYLSNDGGILKKNNRSEFAGLPLEIQKEKIKLGKQILEKNEIEIAAFMAPAHSFDWNTIYALKENNIKVITDGYSVFPYKKKNILFVPQLRSKPKYGGVGIETVCYHTNSMTEQDFIKFEEFINCKINEIVSFTEVTGKVYEKNRIKWRLCNIIFKPIFYVRNTLIRLKRNIR